jgi:hypothetical protein
MSTAVLSKNKWPFSPQTIPTLALWLDAADTSSLVLSGSSVTTWKDKSGNGQDVLGYAGGIGQTTLNGNNALNFGSSTMYSPNFVWKSTFTQFFVAQVGSGGLIINTQVGGVAYGDYVFTQNGTLLDVNNFSTNTGIQFLDSAYSLGTSVVPYNQWFLFCIGYDGVSTSAVNYTINGTTRSTSVYSGSPVSVTNQALNLYINGVSTTNLGTGVLIAEIIHFNSSLNTTQRQQVEGYLGQKWGLQTSLPSTHPYSTNPIDSYPGLQLWLDSVDPLGDGSFPVNGSTVSTWVDKSGKGNNATSAGSSVATSYLGLGFGGSSYFTVSGLAGTLVNTPFVIFIVETLYGSAYNFLFGDDNVNSGGSYGYSLHIGYRNPNDLAFAMYGSDLEDTAISGTGSTRIWAFYLPSSSNRNTRRNGAVDVTFSNYNQLQAFTAPVIGRVFGGNYYNGYISEVIVFNQDIGLSGIQSIEKYLSTKWNVALSSTVYLPQLSRSVFSRPFQPVDITGCQLWLDAADTTSLVLSGTSVTTWKDKSGNAYNATGGVSPTYVSNSQNGLGTVYFNGANNYLLSSLTVNAASHTMIIVHNPNNVNTNYDNNDTSLLRFQVTLGFIVYPYNTGGRYGYINSFGPSGIFGQLPEGDVANVYNIIEAVIATGSQQTYHNGSVVASYSATLYSTSSDSLSIGAYGVSPYQQQYYGGSVAEIIIYDSPLTDSQRQQVESYLAWKWGLRSSLPSGHPGYSLPSYAVMFTPKSISGLQLWLDAVDSSSLVLSGSNVTTWIDKSGNGYNATSTGTPTVVSNGINRLQSVSLAGSSYFTGSMNINGTSLTCFAVALTTRSMPNSSSDQRLVSLANTTNVDYGRTDGTIALFNQGGSGWIGTWRVSGPIAYNAITTNVPFLAVSEYDGTNGYLWYNGNAGTLASSSSSGTFGITKYGIGNQANPTIEYWNGTIAEIIIYNSALSLSQRQQVEGYLAWKWGIQSSLPSTHAFAKISP